MDLKQIFLVNNNLNMGKGKICSQVSHGTIMYIEHIFSTSNQEMIKRYKSWRAETPEDPIGMMKKIVLKSTESEIRDIYNRLKSLNIWSYLIFDKGLTQIPENSLTCLVVEPLEESQYNTLFGNLKLL